eukprot:2745168-Prymnesium_polylepis.1
MFFIPGSTVVLVGLEITGGYFSSSSVSSTAADSFCPRAPHFPWHPSACSVGHPPERRERCGTHTRV